MVIAPFLAVVTDIHIGATTANRWHNQFLSDHPERTLAATVAALNRQRPDFALVLGDLSDDATDEQLSLARSLLDQIEAPWIVCQGNHDVGESGEREAWDRTFGDRAPVGVVPAGLLPLPEGVVAAAFEGRSQDVDGQWRIFIAEEHAAATLADLRGMRPELLLVPCHFPFMRQSAHVRAFGGKNAGTLWDGEALLGELAATADRTLVLCGHQHFHHIAAASDGPRWLHCTTASQAEWPAEFRVIAVEDSRASFQMLQGVPEIVASALPPVETWVAGRPEDREFVWNW